MERRADTQEKMENNNSNIISTDQLATAADYENLFLPKEGWVDVDVSKSYLDVTQKYDSPRYSLLINGVPCAPVGGMHVITGQPGHGKTNTQAQFIAAYLGDTSHGIEYNLGDTRPNPKVLYIDTEMEPENTMMVNLRVCAMCGRDYHTKYDDFDILVLRNEVSAEDRWLKILKSIYEKKPDVVFIDGMIDIVADFNDNKQCQELIFKCMALATHYDINLWCTIHQNPNTDKLTGHAGSFLQRKATDIYQTKKEKNVDGNVTFTITQIKARGKDVPDLKFRIHDWGGRYAFGVPETLNAEQSSPDKTLATFLINNESVFKWPVSKKDIKERMPGLSAAKTKNVDLMIDKGMLVDSGEKKGGYPTYNLDLSKCKEFAGMMPF